MILDNIINYNPRLIYNMIANKYWYQSCLFLVLLIWSFSLLNLSVWTNIKLSFLFTMEESK